MYPMLFLELSLDGNPVERVVVQLHRDDPPHVADRMLETICTDKNPRVTAVELFYSSRLELDPSEEVHDDLCYKVPEAYFWLDGVPKQSLLVVFTHMHFLNRCCLVYGKVVEGNETIFKIRQSAEVVEITGCGNVSEEENNRLTQAQIAEAKKNNYWSHLQLPPSRRVESAEDTVMGSDDGKNKVIKKRVISSDRPEINTNPVCVKRKFSSYSGPEPDKGEKKAPSTLRMMRRPSGIPLPWQPGHAEHPEVIKSRKAMEAIIAEQAKRRAEQTPTPRILPLKPWQRNCPYNFTVEQDFSRTPNVPVYVMLPLGIINMKCELVDPDHPLWSQLETLKKSVNVDGVAVDVCWGIVEANNPQEYNWGGYKQLFGMLLPLDLKIKVAMSFHECRGGDGVYIPLPKWITETGPDIYFTDSKGNRNLECLTWGIDNEPVLRGRTALQVYSDFMRSFRAEFDEFFQKKSITKIQIGLGPSGELRYPSFCPPNEHASGTSEFQCYDKYLSKCLKNAANAKPGSYNNSSEETENSRIFLKWYSQYLVDHAESVMSVAKLAFQQPGYLSVKVSGKHWWLESDDSRAKAAELTAGFGDGYAPLISMLNKHDVSLDFTCAAELTTLDLQRIFKPKSFVSEVLNGAWNSRVQVSSENAARPCYYDSEGYNKILELVKPRNVKHRRRHLAAFTYHGFNQALFEQDNLKEFLQFVKKMHGVAADGEDWTRI